MSGTQLGGRPLLFAVLVGLGGCQGSVGSVESAVGENRIVVVPTGTLEDAQNVQDAVDHVAVGGTVRLAAGTFDFGEGDERRTVVVRRGMRIEGAPGGEPTIIRGGGASFPLGIPITGIWAADVSNGPFRVDVESEGESVSFERLEFRRWENQAITAVAAGGLSVIDCTFGDPVAVPWPSEPDRASPAVAGVKIVTAVFVMGPEVRGRFLARGNVADLLTDYEGSLADDETFIALLFTSFDDVRIERNTIRGHDDGLEVLRNKFDLSEYGLAAPSEGPSAIRVADNEIELLQIPPSIPMKWYGMAAIAVAGNERVSEGIVEDNEVTLISTPIGYGSLFTGSNLLVRRNAFTVLPLAEDAFPAGVFALGYGNPFAGSPFNLGASLDDSVLEDNVFEGRATIGAVAFVDRTIPLPAVPPIPGSEPNRSHGNHISLDRSAVTLGGLATLFVTPWVHDNTFAGHCGTVIDLSPPGANTYLGAHCRPPAE